MQDGLFVNFADFQSQSIYMYAFRRKKIWKQRNYKKVQLQMKLLTGQKQSHQRDINVAY